MVGSLLKRLFNFESAIPTATLTPNDEAGKLKSANDAIAIQDFSCAVEYCKELVNAQSQNPDVYVSYGYALLNLGQFANAKTILTTAAKLAPQSADAQYMLGKVCVELQDPDTAEQAWTRCYALSQEIEALYCDFCMLLFSRGKPGQAIDLMSSGVKKFPLNADIHFFLGNLHAETANYAIAVPIYAKSLSLNPESAYLLSNYATALRQVGDLTRANELVMRASLMAPESASIFSNYLLGMQYSALFTKAEKFTAHLEYARKFESPVLSHWGNYRNSLALEKKIHVGYVSGDFRNHSLIFFIAPILANHNKSKFEVYGYYACPLPDADTLRVKKFCDVWVTCHDMSDDALEARIRADEIDILIDLSGHTGHNRLLTFARKPAPIQMTWLGYQATTGLSAMDYRITEEALDPTGSSEVFHSEKLLRLPSSGTFSPLPDSPPVNELPALGGAAFTFACLNNPSKITDEAIKLWSQILKAAPTARLMIGNATPAWVDKISGQFSLHQVESGRLVFQPKVGIREYLQLHHQVDLALDTFPYNGGTTSFHSLWMGIPIVVLEGDTALSKVGASIMNGLGLPQFSCASPQNYIDTAVYFSTHLQELSVIRLSLRQQMAVLLQLLAKSVTQFLETALEDCWDKYRQTRIAEVQVGK